MNYQIPILLIVFNRPKCVELLINSIAQVKPAYLFVSVDGPRVNYVDDIENINQTIHVIKSLVSWDCELVFNISQNNQGVKMGPFNAIKWFFNLNEMGVILEDDCIPSVTFFNFCEEMLKKYKNDTRIGLISGRNDCDDISLSESYFFSTSGSIWGWASWARVIDQYEVNEINYLDNINKNLFSSTLDSMQANRLAYHLKWAIFDNFLIKTWDYQLHAYLKLNYHLYIIPKVNLIKNVGFGADATHTKSIEKRTNLNSKNLQLPIIHPKWVFPNRELSRRIYRADSNKWFIWWYLVIRFHIQNFLNKK
jgi:hypothetical protein